MFTRTMYLIGLTLYTILTSVLLVYFNADILWTLFFLSVIPAVVLWRLERLKSLLIVWVMLFAAVCTLTVEVIAYINGIWYELASTEIRVFDLFPVESFIVAFVHILYFIVLYEYFFDDKRMSKKVKDVRAIRVLLLGVGVILGIGLTYLYIFSGFFLPHAYAWVLMVATMLFLFGVAYAKNISFAVLKKGSFFALSIFPISLAYEYVSLSNNLRFFANAPDYLWYIELFENIVPLEEFVFILLVPFWIAVTYELYIDDGA